MLVNIKKKIKKRQALALGMKSEIAFKNPK